MISCPFGVRKSALKAGANDRRHRVRFRPVVEILEGRTLPATVTWINPAGGDWDTASNWDAGRVPTASDDAVINIGNVTVTHATAAVDAANSLTCNAAFALSNGSLSLAGASTFADALSLTGGTLTGSGDQTIQGMFTWSNGTLKGPGHTRAQGGMTLGANGSSGGPHLDNRAVDNAGLGTWTGTLPIFAENGAVLTNLAGATSRPTATWCSTRLDARSRTRACFANPRALGPPCSPLLSTTMAWCRWTPGRCG